MAPTGRGTGKSGLRPMTEQRGRRKGTHRTAPDCPRCARAATAFTVPERRAEAPITPGRRHPRCPVGVEVNGEGVDV
jgi:hypothetical protein